MLSTWGTDDELDDVVAAYEAIGFRGQEARIDPETGEQSPTGELVRWIAERGLRTKWRKVDAYQGWVGGHGEWATVIELYAPPQRCMADKA